MPVSIIFFAAGVAWLQWQPALPDVSGIFLMGGLALGLAALAASKPRWRAAVLPAAFLFGVAWAAGYGLQRLADQLPEASEGRDMQVSGVVDSLPQAFEHGWRFDFRIEQASLPAPQRVSLAWYRPSREQDDPQEGAIPAVHAGERWDLRIRLKRPHGNLNPAGFDYEGWLFEQGIRATGYVRPGAGNQRRDAFVATPRTLVERWRETVRARFQQALGEAPYGGILIALALGDQRAIDSSQWQVFSRTGLTHLMSISGLHITMVAGLAYALANLLWRRSDRLALRLPAQQAGVAGGLVAAWGYCLLAGFAVPAQRTLYMLCTLALALWLRRNVPARVALSLALALVLLLDPWAVLAAGFWLSFGAVALLFYVGTGRLDPGHWLAQWGRAQWAMSLGMLPLLLALFQQCSLVAPLANAVAIPLVSFVITPLVLAATLPGFEFLLAPAHGLTAPLMALVEWLGAVPWAVWQQHAPPAWATALALLGTLWLLLPRGFPARWLGLVLYLPLFFVPPPRPAAGEWRLVVLDVGQGLAAHVQTRDHDLIFDTGPAFSPDANSGNRILVPYLRAAGVRALDGLIISHQDKDHSGGAESLIDAVPTGWLLSSLDVAVEPAQAPSRTHCRDGQHWEWDGVRFEMLHPVTAAYADPTPKTNDMSCVLRVSSPRGTALLGADIEAKSEAALLARHGNTLKADVLLVPHHGSRTSSTAAFVQAVGARYAVFPVGYRNRFGHPKDEVVERYRASGATLLRTDREGAVSVSFAGEGIGVREERAVRRRYWQEK
jgi:competence protein ComEC